jgi:hypothetical protein
VAIDEGILLVAIAGAAVLEAYFVLKAVYEARAARVYQLLVDELRRLGRV